MNDSIPVQDERTLLGVLQGVAKALESTLPC
jgi:hypothetical protein